MNLHDVLKNGYKKNKSKSLNGYELDTQLSNHNNQIYYNKKENKLHHNINGTNSLYDWGVNAYLAVGKLKDTNRYKESHRKLRQAKEKYGIDSASISGHSQAGQTASYIAGNNDKVITLDKASTIGGTSKKNETDYRTNGDLVSILNVGRKHNVTLDNPNKSSGNIIKDILNAHDVNNIKNNKIFT